MKLDPHCFSLQTYKYSNKSIDTKHTFSNFKMLSFVHVCTLHETLTLFFHSGEKESCAALKQWLWWWKRKGKCMNCGKVCTYKKKYWKKKYTYKKKKKQRQKYINKCRERKVLKDQKKKRKRPNEDILKLQNMNMRTVSVSANLFNFEVN